MANFKMHLAVATVGSGFVSSALLGADIVSPGEAAALWAAGSIGGIMPDIDADRSSAAENIFTGLGLVLALAMMVGLASLCPTLLLWLASVITYIVVRYGVLQIFYTFTHHRGIFHSVVAGAFFWFVVTAISYHVLDLGAQSSWTIGFLVFFGFLLHLMLDEAYSVDLQDQRLERSFGTAFKLLDYHNLKTSGVMAIAALGMFFATPSFRVFIDFVRDAQTYRDIFSSLVP